jgi:hypothetical protein
MAQEESQSYYGPTILNLHQPRAWFSIVIMSARHRRRRGRKLKRVFELLIQEPALTGSVTDFKSLLVNQNKIEDMEIEVAYRSEFEDEPQPNARPYRVKIQGTGYVEVSVLLGYIKST